MITDTEQLRIAGCKCQEPLIGYTPGIGPRCRLCNTVTTTELVGVTTKIDGIIEKLREAVKLRKDSQDALLMYCRDKSIHLDKRFPVWVDFVDKIHKSWGLSVDDFPPIGKWFRECQPVDYDRYVTYTWKDFLSYVEDAVGANDKWNVWVKPIKSVDEFKELLIEHNFGSFLHDW